MTVLLSKIGTVSALLVPKSRLTTKFHGKLVKIYQKLAGIFSDQSGFRDFKGRHRGRSLNPDYAVIVTAKKLFWRGVASGEKKSGMKNDCTGHTCNRHSITCPAAF